MDPLMLPTPGRIVLYRSRTGLYTVPAIVTATRETLYQGGVDAGHVPALSSDTHVHLTVFTPGLPGKRKGAEDFVSTSSAVVRDGEHEQVAPVGENVAGCYQEWDVPLYELAELDYPAADFMAPGDVPTAQAPGTWAWPRRG